METPSPNQQPRALVAELVAANSLARPVLVNGVPHAVVPNDYRLGSLERTLHSPARKRGAFEVFDANSFNTLVNLWREGDEDDDPLPLFFKRSGTSAVITAVMNFYDWRDLTVSLAQRLSTPFSEWYGKNGASLTQRAFATFLEERTHHVAKPEGAALLELSRKFKANVSVRYQSVIEDQNGDNSLEFIQTTEAGNASAKSRMKVPDRITLFMPVWHGGASFRFDARFGYSIGDDGKLALSFQILNLEELLSMTLLNIVQAIQKEHVNSHVIEGCNVGVPELKY